MKDQSVAPKARVNITYKSTVGDAQQEVELPLKFLVVGDFTGRPDERLLEKREPISVDKNNFKEVMEHQNLKVSVTVPNRLSSTPGEEMSANLEFRDLKDFEPDGIAAQVPELRKLLELRNTLKQLQHPVTNPGPFRDLLSKILKDPEQTKRLMRELGLSAE